MHGGVTSEWGDSAFRFVGNEGLMELAGSGVTISRRPRLAKDWGAEPTGEQAVAEATTHRFTAPDGYSAHLDHFRNFFAAVRSRQPVVEDGLFGLRAAAPSLLCNMSYDNTRPIGWDPETFEVTAG